MKRWFWSVSVLLTLMMLISVNAQEPPGGGGDPPDTYNASCNVVYGGWRGPEIDAGYSIWGSWKVEITSPGHYWWTVKVYPLCMCEDFDCPCWSPYYLVAPVLGSGIHVQEEGDESIVYTENFFVHTQLGVGQPWWSEYGHFVTIELHVDPDGDHLTDDDIFWDYDDVFFAFYE